MKDETTDIAIKDFVKEEISESKTDMIKWFVGLLMILAAMIMGLYFRK